MEFGVEFVSEDLSGDIVKGIKMAEELENP